MESNKIKLQKNIIKYNIYLIPIAILLIIIGFGIIKADEKSKQPIPEPIPIANIKGADEYASIDVQLLTDPFASDDEDEYRFVMDKDKYIYIAVLSKNDVEILKEINEYTYSDDDNIKIPATIKIVGMTQEIDPKLKKLAIESYNELYGENLLNENNFKEYIANVYLNTKLSPSDISLETGIVGLSAIFVIILLIIYLEMIIRTKRTLREYTLNGTLDYIYYQLDQLDTLEYNKGKIFLAREYIVTSKEGLIIIKYDDIKWMYPYIVERHGITVGRYIKIVKNDKTKVTVSVIQGFDKNNGTEIFNTVYNEICQRAPNALSGYTQENMKLSKNM
jgi:hypothetical protein